MTEATLPLLYNVVYCSRATVAVDAAVLDDIVGTARRHNACHGITGLLVYGSGIFFQWLEGPHDEVRALMTRIHADPRHDGLLELATQEELRERLFPDWDMELVEPLDIRAVLLDALSDAECPEHGALLRGMLRQLDDGAVSAMLSGRA